MTTTPIAAGPNDVTVRAQFERWYSNDGKWSSALERSGDGYKYQGADHAWHVWQAAVSQEREACAKLVSDIGDDWEHIGDMQKVSACDYLEDAIRMRSNANVCGLPHGKEIK